MNHLEYIMAAAALADTYEPSNGVIHARNRCRHWQSDRSHNGTRQTGFGKHRAKRKPLQRLISR